MRHKNKETYGGGGGGGLGAGGGGGGGGGRLKIIKNFLNIFLSNKEGK